MPALDLTLLGLPWRLFMARWVCRDSMLELILVRVDADIKMVGLGGTRTGARTPAAPSGAERPERVAVRFRGVRDLRMDLPASEAVVVLDVTPETTMPSSPLLVWDTAAQSSISLRCDRIESSEVAATDTALTLAFEPGLWHVTLSDGAVMTVWATCFSESETETVFSTFIDGLPLKEVEVLHIPRASVAGIVSGPDDQLGRWRMDPKA
jgi:hypothetical protein